MNSISKYSFEGCPDVLGQPHAYESFDEILDPTSREITELSMKHSRIVANFEPDRTRESMGAAINDMYRFIYDCTPHYRKYGFPHGLVYIEEEIVPLFPQVATWRYSGDYRREFSVEQLNTVDRGLQWLDRLVDIARNTAYPRLPADECVQVINLQNQSRELIPTRDALRDGIPLGYSFDHMLQHRVV